MIDRRLLINFDWSLLLITIILCSVGILLIYSSATGPFTQVKQGLHIKQIYWIGIAFIAMLLIISIDYHHLVRWSFLFYLLNLLALGYILYSSKSRVERWIRFFGFNIQPSEFTKYFIILLFAWILKDRKLKEISAKEYIFIFLIISIPLILIIKQPDLGTAFLLIPIALALFYISGIPLKWLLWAFISGMVASPVFWFSLKPYQKNRILSFVNPKLDPLGAGYQVIQSKIAVGSGRILGRGFLNGTQCRLKFIPQHHTDFIFTLLAEEWGLIGSSLVLFLFLLLLLKGMDICAHAKDRQGLIISYAIVVVFALHILINIGMVIGIMPVTGIPLPFISYGGSAMFSNFIAVGLLLNIKMRRFD